MSLDDDDEGTSLAQEMAAFGDELMGKAYPNGEYDVLVKRATAAKSGTGKACLKVSLQIQGGKYDGKTVPDQLTWSPESEVAARIFATGVSKMGADPSWIKSTNASMAQVAARIQGAKVHVKLSEDSFNGIPRNRVAYTKLISPGGSGGNGGAAGVGENIEDLSDEPPVTVPDSADAVSIGDDDWP